MNPAPETMHGTSSSAELEQTATLLRLRVREQTQGLYEVTVTLLAGSRTVHGSGSGASDFTALFRAIGDALGWQGRILGLAVRLIPAAGGAGHEVRLGVGRGGRAGMGCAVAADPLEAAAHAYLAAAASAGDRPRPG